ncbi:phytoene/squalene synthase family protein [Sphingomonas aracearum]|uniref:phytoene/squalene synthase family protein n=1 Tax=Sphingomonas aracearum TaxID=2283317 RepID=UPI001EEFD07D|nr:phytoene/squalene synthase family protein [Sphingomonas aracearum]
MVATARESIFKGSKSFAAASLLFDRRTRERAWLLYGWCRACDDLADGQDHGHELQAVTDAPERLAKITAFTQAALAGQWIGDPAFDGFRIVAAETRLPPRFARDLVAGFALDAEDWRPRNEEDLYLYCYHVAGVVGCMMAVVMGVPPEDEDTLDRACDLGMAFQLANIARDVAEDARGGRCYLPADWLAELGIPADDLLNPARRDQLAVLGRRLAERATRFEESAMGGTPALSFRSAWAVIAAARIYGQIAREVAARGPAAWDARVSTSGLDKLRFIAAAARDASGRERWRNIPRDVPWTRPR